MDKVNIMHEFEVFNVTVLHKRVTMLDWLKVFVIQTTSHFYISKDKRPFNYALIVN